MSQILVVEDNDDVREMMAVTLELEGHKVTTAANGRQALAVLENGLKPSLILLDLMMPTADPANAVSRGYDMVMNGWELRTALQRDPRFSAIPIVIVSAVGGELVSGVNAGLYLPKPIDVDTLLDVVCDYCDDGIRH